MVESTNFDFGDASSGIVVDPASVIGTGGGPIGGTGDTPTGDVEQYSRDAAGNFIRNADGSFRRKRGRRAGSGSGASRSGPKPPKARADTVETIARIVAILHVGIATASKTPEMALDDDEAKLLAAPLHDVLAQFNIRPDPRFEAVLALITAAGVVYGPRVYNIQTRLKSEKKAKGKQADDNTVVNFPSTTGFDFTG